MTRIALLDVNVLVALFDPDHIHHEAAHDWFAASRQGGWATCPLTENGFVRILSNVAYSEVPETADAIRRRLHVFSRSGGRSFWPDHVSLRDTRVFKLSAVTHAQITDVYLLGLATAKGGRLATFNRRIALAAVVGAEQDRVDVIPA